MLSRPGICAGGMTCGRCRVNAIRIVLVVVDAVVGLTAIGGGIALAAGLEGERYPVEWLTGTPFSSYLIPGLILSVAVGGSAAAAAVLIVTTPEVGGVGLGAGRGDLDGADRRGDPAAHTARYLDRGRVFRSRAGDGVAGADPSGGVARRRRLSGRRGCAWRGTTASCRVPFRAATVSPEATWEPEARGASAR